MERFYLICAYVLAGVLGLCVGSFLNVLIYRLPRGMNIATPPSHCTKCGYRLRWYDNIPVLSYCILRGKCRKCGERISPRYTVVELLNCGLWLACVAAFWRYGVGYTVVCALALSALTVEFFADLETMTVPDSMTIGIALCGIAALVLEIFGLGAGITWQNRLWGALAGLGSFALFYFGSLLILKREGLGFGDVKLMGAAGLLLGWQNLIVSVLFASVSAVLVMGVGRLAFRRKEEAPAGEPETDSAETPVKTAASNAEEGASLAAESAAAAAAATTETTAKAAQTATEPSAQTAAGASPQDAASAQPSAGESEEEAEKRPFEFPFAPFLAAGIALALFFGNALCAWYIGLFA